MIDEAKLRLEIEQKETQLYRAEQESDAWNKGKYKTSSNADVSKIYVKSLRNELQELREKLVTVTKSKII
ncbi:MAG: hypothetical protein HN661_03895 [Gammaproteobacteria bacterium]|nr:hypothetical protein [Gammaproteobacteria bacterium]MBT6651610.1 hypothetical protein [Gammaproteobacteria bacterium]MBT7139796.1 hypothetical protein [Gammaproteobacteria bacterium]MBT7478644.1 hypothetical protein [Gammaproteobacteria bacterium]HIJ28648.1 hypothetical protein [Gammaproteobacteria bacterium]